MLFSASLQTALLAPFTIAALCVVVLFAGVLPPRSVQAVSLGLLIGLCGLVELFAVPLAFYRLARAPELRTAKHWAFSIAGLSLLLIVVSVWVIALYA